MTTPVPDALPAEQAAVLPLAVSTAAAGLFEPDQLALPLPTAGAIDRDGVVLVWGASTSVGANAVQLARAAGYAVIGTASPKNHAFVQDLGAEAVFDYRDDGAARRILEALADRDLAGTLAFGQGSLTRTLPIVRAATGSGRLASAYPTPVTTIRARLERRHGVHVTAIWGGRRRSPRSAPRSTATSCPRRSAPVGTAPPDRIRRRIGTRRGPGRPRRAPRGCLCQEARRHAPLSR